MVRIAFDESAKAESLVVFNDHSTHAIHALSEVRTPFAKLGGRRVILGKALCNRVGGELSRLESQQDARRVERIEEAECVADQNPTVAGRLFGVIGVFL